ncbi:MAG: ABC transporter ATP-binding protein [Chloroflexi bacterium]|nr:ABC transporter ATP-binding protein [Chloroflexota bacterium]|tara:strand:+ start:3279 stop:4151 length:873 start_codon:yes stop_codon:yes gene_type:complete
MPAVLEAKNVTKVFGGGFLSREEENVAVNDISMSLDQKNPKIVAVAGESGSGKTTLARLLLGIAAPTSGSVEYDGKDLTEISRKERREFRREVQPIFQDPYGSYNPFYKVDHVLFSPVKNFKMAQSRDEAVHMVNQALEMVGLVPEETLGRLPHQLSGGQRQRVMVARALLLKPRVILADEPVSAVDASLRATILDAVSRLNKELGIAVVYVTHDLTTAYQISDEIMILYKGNLVEAGSVETVIKKPAHPYTQLLIDSIPEADPNKRWGKLDMKKTQEKIVTAPSVGWRS